MTTPSLTNPNPKREDEILTPAGRKLFRALDESDQLFSASNAQINAAASALASARPSPGDPVRAALAPFVAHYQPWMDDWDDDSPCGAYARVTFGDLRRARAVISAPEGKATAIRSFPSDPSQKPLGYYFHNPDSGWEISDSHPITSGECEDATEIEQLTPARLKELLLQAWDDAEELRAERDDAALSVSTPTAAITVGVQTMKTSKGADYYVSVACGGRSCTPHMFLDRYKAEYEVAHWQWIFGQREEEPCILDYSEETYPNLYPKMEIPPVSTPTGEVEEGGSTPTQLAAETPQPVAVMDTVDLSVRCDFCVTMLGQRVKNRCCVRCNPPLPRAPKAETPADEGELPPQDLKGFHRLGWIAGCHGPSLPPGIVQELINLATEWDRQDAAPAHPQQEWDGVLAEVAAERRRQIEVEGWTPEHDDSHDKCELISAAATYAMAGAMQTEFLRENFLGEWDSGTFSKVRHQWPNGWDWSWFKPTDHRRDIIKVLALGVAEIERMDRAAASPKPGPYVADEHGTPITGLSWCATHVRDRTTPNCPSCGVGPLEACRGRVPQDDEAPKVSTNQALADIDRNDHE